MIARGRDGSADIRAVLGADVDMQTRLVYGEGVPYLSRVRVDIGQPGARVMRDAPMLLAINQQEADVGGWLAQAQAVVTGAEPDRQCGSRPGLPAAGVVGGWSAGPRLYRQRHPQGGAFHRGADQSGDRSDDRQPRCDGGDPPACSGQSSGGCQVCPHLLVRQEFGSQPGSRCQTGQRHHGLHPLVEGELCRLPLWRATSW